MATTRVLSLLMNFDSCIYQDNLDDWAAEAQQMRLIYAHAECNIAATSAENSEIGLFFERDPFVLTPFEIELTRISDGMPRSAQVQRYACELTRQEPIDTIVNQPLNVRAWVAQETYLSSRMMHFTKTYLYWQCNESFANELYPHGLPASASYTPGPRELRNMVQRLRLNHLIQCNSIDSNEKSHLYTCEERESIYRAWCAFRQLYTKCQLSREEDKIAAILGIAADIEDFFSDAPAESHNLSANFTACLWRSCIIRELCWSHHTWGTEASSDEYAALLDLHAPSWSWASTKNVTIHSGCNFRYDGLRIESLAAVLSIQVNYRSDWTCSGTIQLACRPLQAVLSPQHLVQAYLRQFRLQDPDDKDLEGHLALDRPHLHKEEQAIFIVVLQCYKKDDGVYDYEGIGITASEVFPGTFTRIGHFHCASVMDDKGEHETFNLFKSQYDRTDTQIITIV